MSKPTNSLAKLTVVQGEQALDEVVSRDMHNPTSGQRDDDQNDHDGPQTATRPADEARDFHEHLERVLPLVWATGDRTDQGDPQNLYVQISHGGLTALYPLGSRRVLDHINYLGDQFSGGDSKLVISPRKFPDLQAQIRAKAYRIAARRPVSKRVAWMPDDGELWLDLTSPTGQCVRINGGGWTVEEPLHPLFVRYPTQAPLPVPVASEDGEAAFIRLLPPSMTPEQRKLLTGAILSCFLPPTFAASFSYPIILLTGEAGSGKSTLAKLIKRLIDNEVTATAAKPAKADDLYVAAQTSMCLSWDNIDFVRGSLSDALCGLTTGSAIAKRTLYTNGDLTILKGHCPVLLNGIHPDLPRSDMLDRTVSIHLTRIQDFRGATPDQIEADLPLALGYLLTLLSRALRNLPATKLANPPRLELVARLATASEPFGGCEASFLDLLRANQEDALLGSHDNDLIIAALHNHMDGKPRWKGTYKDLFTSLTSRADESSTRAREWPDSPRALALYMRQQAALLRAQGLEFVDGPKTKRGRVLTITCPATATDEIPF